MGFFGSKFSAGARFALFGWCVLSASCLGNLGGDEEGSESTGVPADPDDPQSGSKDPAVIGLPGKELAASSPFRRLTSDEYDNALRDLVGETSRASHLVLPEDLRSPFDNDFSLQRVSAALVEGAELAARDVSTSL